MFDPVIRIFSICCIVVQRIRSAWDEMTRDALDKIFIYFPTCGVYQIKSDFFLITTSTSIIRTLIKIQKLTPCVVCSVSVNN